MDGTGQALGAGLECLGIIQRRGAKGRVGVHLDVRGNSTGDNQAKASLCPGGEIGRIAFIKAAVLPKGYRWSWVQPNSGF